MYERKTAPKTARRPLITPLLATALLAALLLAPMPALAAPAVDAAPTATANGWSDGLQSLWGGLSLLWERLGEWADPQLADAPQEDALPSARTAESSDGGSQGISAGLDPVGAQ